MNAEQLSKVGSDLVRRCGTRDPFQIANALGINVMDDCENLGSLKGILAITVCQAEWDRRYSPDNRAWANAMSIPANPDAWGTDRNCYLAVSSHPGLVDLFLSQTRKAYAQEQQKPSVRDMLKKLPETTSPKISAKSKSPER